MARDPAPPHITGGFSYARPWFVLGIALALVVVGCLLTALGDRLPGFVRLAFVFPATLLAVVAVSRQLQQAHWAFPNRIETAAIVSVAGLVAVGSYWCMAQDWESGRMFYGAVFLVALVGSILILLPTLLRRVALTFIILFHFTGMASTITSVDPPNASGAWISKQLWAWVYRPYLSFLYLTNAYHFYSPDPGPPNLLWFAVCYDDGSYTWIKLPERANSPISMHYQRHLALPEHSFVPMPFPVLPTRERGTWDEIYHRRELGSTINYKPAQQRGKRPMSRSTVIPMIQDLEVTWQYRQPAEVSKKLLASLAKRVYWTAPEAPREGVRKKSVKLYRVTHQILTPAELAKGISPWAEEKHWPIFLGEFDGSGTLLNPGDPFLYWQIPIVVVPPSYPDHGLSTRPGIPAVRIRDEGPKDGVLLDGLEMHAAGPITSKEEEKN